MTRGVAQPHRACLSGIGPLHYERIHGVDQRLLKPPMQSLLVSIQFVLLFIPLPPIPLPDHRALSFGKGIDGKGMKAEVLRAEPATSFCR